MARFVVILPVVAIVDTGPSTAISPDAAIATANSWLVLPANSGLVVASKTIEGKAYNAPEAPAGTANISNTQLASAARSTIEQILP